MTTNTKYEHPRFERLERMLHVLALTNERLLVNSSDRIFVRFLQHVTRHESGGCSCGARYDSLSFGGVAFQEGSKTNSTKSKKSKKSTKSTKSRKSNKWPARFDCAVSQYDAHPCKYDAVLHTDATTRTINLHPLLFKFNIDNDCCCYHVYVPWRSLDKSFVAACKRIRQATPMLFLPRALRLLVLAYAFPALSM